MQANISEQAGDIRNLFLKYYDELLGIDVCFEDFENELSNLENLYSHPRGDLLLLVEGQDILACVALVRIDQRLCEMKRLYVLPEYRGRGLGRMLAEAIIKKAIQSGYLNMRLDTLDGLKEALNLYQSLGFREIPAYLENVPVKLVYLQLDLENEGI